MTDLDKLTEAIRQYCARYHILQFTVSEPYNLDTQWKVDYFPSAKHAGCYAYFDADMNLLYIGKASCGSSIGTRAGVHHRWDEFLNRIIRDAPGTWNSEAHYLFTVPVHEPHQAPSLEEYLIERLSPIGNTTGRRA